MEKATFNEVVGTSFDYEGIHHITETLRDYGQEVTVLK